jgi:hypothetical protein
MDLIEFLIISALQEEAELPEAKNLEIVNKIVDHVILESKINDMETFPCDRKTCYQNEKGECLIKCEPDTCNNYDHEIYFRHIKK